MYIFYADESGFSKSTKFEKEQPVIVVGGILVNLVKLNKALTVYDSIISKINRKLPDDKELRELKFTRIKDGRNVIKSGFPKVIDRSDLLNEIFKKFLTEIPGLKIFYSAIDQEKYYQLKRINNIIKSEFPHSYLFAGYRIMAQTELFLTGKKNNKGKSFMVFDEQNKYQSNLEKLHAYPVHQKSYTEIIDIYFGKSHYSKLIQIADLIVGMIRYYHFRMLEGKMMTDGVII